MMYSLKNKHLHFFKKKKTKTTYLCILTKKCHVNNQKMVQKYGGIRVILILF